MIHMISVRVNLMSYSYVHGAVTGLISHFVHDKCFYPWLVVSCRIAVWCSNWHTHRKCKCFINLSLLRETFLQYNPNIKYFFGVFAGFGYQCYSSHLLVGMV